MARKSSSPNRNSTITGAEFDKIMQSATTHDDFRKKSRPYGLPVMQNKARELYKDIQIGKSFESLFDAVRKAKAGGDTDLPTDSDVDTDIDDDFKHGGNSDGQNSDEDTDNEEYGLDLVDEHEKEQYNIFKEAIKNKHEATFDGLLSSVDGFDLILKWSMKYFKLKVDDVSEQTEDTIWEFLRTKHKERVKKLKEVKKKRQKEFEDFGSKDAPKLINFDIFNLPEERKTKNKKPDGKKPINHTSLSKILQKIFPEMKYLDPLEVVKEFSENQTDMKSKGNKLFKKTMKEVFEDFRKKNNNRKKLYIPNLTTVQLASKRSDPTNYIVNYLYRDNEVRNVCLERKRKETVRMYVLRKAYEGKKMITDKKKQKRRATYIDLSKYFSNENLQKPEVKEEYDNYADGYDETEEETELIQQGMSKLFLQMVVNTWYQRFRNHLVKEVLKKRITKTKMKDVWCNLCTSRRECTKKKNGGGGSKKKNKKTTFNIISRNSVLKQFETKDQQGQQDAKTYIKQKYELNAVKKFMSGRGYKATKWDEIFEHLFDPVLAEKKKTTRKKTSKKK